MIKPRKIKLKLRRIARKQQKQVEGMGTAADDQINRHFFKRLTRLVEVRRFVFGWIALVALLILVGILQFSALRDQFEKEVYVSGGIFNEGIVGTYTNSNPIYATSAVDSSVSKLVFAGLFKYDSENKLVPDLAESIEVDQAETKYTVKLKDNLYWHDGQPLTADDVAFTFNTIKNPDAKSYLLSSWQGVTVDVKDKKTIVFTLKDTLSSFPHSLITGLIPKHGLSDINPEQLRSNDFNSIKPIGAGPFKFDVVQVEKDKDEENNEVKKQQIGLVANDGYRGGKPKLNKYTIKTYKDQAELLDAYKEKKVNSISGFFVPPEDITTDSKTVEFSVPLTGEVMVFFKTSEGVLSDPIVRKALVLASNRGEVINSVSYPLRSVDGPLLSTHVGYNKAYAQKTHDINQAKALLDQAGWVLNPQTGLRAKDNKPLKFQLASENTDEYKVVTETLKKQWKELGVDLEIKLQDEDELKTTVSSHNYDALLYAISIGADPDVFAYWHSTQADPRSKTRLNFSEYKSTVADESLVAGRSRSDPAIRAVKYKPFLENWQKDNPALALYQPRFVLVVRKPFDGFSSKGVVTPIDRYSDVENWAIRQEKRSN